MSSGNHLVIIIIYTFISGLASLAKSFVGKRYLSDSYEKLSLDSDKLLITYINPFLLSAFISGSQKLCCHYDFSLISKHVTSTSLSVNVSTSAPIIFANHLLPISYFFISSVINSAVERDWSLTLYSKTF